MKILNFKDLNAWQEGSRLTIEIYKETKNFPAQEQFGLTNQMRRASVSIISNIAEGFSRHGIKEKIQFYYMALGSNSELQSQIFISTEIGYLEINKSEKLLVMSDNVGRLLSGLIRSTNKR